MCSVYIRVYKHFWDDYFFFFFRLDARRHYTDSGNGRDGDV